MKAYRAVLIGPPPEDFVLLVTTSSWRRRQSSAIEAGNAFRLATEIEDVILSYRIEKAEVEVCTIAWLREGTNVIGEETMLLPISSANRFADARTGLLEKFADQSMSVQSISTRRLGACELRKLRKNIR